MTPALDCELRALAWQYSEALQPRASRHVFEALRLGAACNQSWRAGPSLPARSSTAATGAPWSSSSWSDPPVQVYVAVDGDDVHGTGTVGSPFRTPARGRDEVRIQRRALPAGTPATVLLRGGTYYLDETLFLGAADAQLTFAAFPGEQVTLSGGVPFSPQWTQQGAIAVAALPGWDGSPIASLFVNGTAAIRARFPNGNPATDLQPTNYIPADGT
jgi:hypothetical protein